MSKEVLSYKKIETPDFEQEFNVLSDGAIIGSVFFNGRTWGAKTNFDAPAAWIENTRHKAAHKLARRHRKGM